MINGIIFDMDGVLVDSEPAITRASMAALAEWGVEAEYGDFKQYTGMGDDLFIGGVARKYGREYDLRMKARAYEIYLEKADEWVKVYPWSKPLIDLFSKKYKLAVASASDRVKVECNLRCIGADPSVFSALLTGSDVKNKKPAPDIFLLAAEKAGFDSKSAVVFEDAVSGVMAAKAAGCVCIAVTTSFPAGKLYQAGADFAVDDLSLAPEIIEKL